MVRPNFCFWSISRKESLQSQQKHAPIKKFLRTLLWSNDFSYPGYNRKVLVGERTSILDGACFNYEKLFHSVHCTACRICLSGSRNKLVFPEVTGLLSISDQFHYFWGISCFGNGTWQYSTGLYQYGKLHLLFSYHYILSNLGKIFLLWIYAVAFLLHFWQLLRFNYSQCIYFGRSFWSSKSNMIKSQLWFCFEKKFSIIPNVPIHPDLSTKKNEKE